MSTTTASAVTPKAPDAPVPAKFAEAYAELEAIAKELKTAPDVDRIEPLVRRAQKLAAHCEGRIREVKALLDTQAAAA